MFCSITYKLCVLFVHVYSIFTNMANSIVVRDGMKEADEHWKYLPPFLWLRFRDETLNKDRAYKGCSKETHIYCQSYLKTVVLLR